MSKEIEDDVHVIMIWDGAGHHTSGELVVPNNITTIKLPSSSPELNPIENLWHYVRSYHWSNRKYAGYDALRGLAGDVPQYEHHPICLQSGLPVMTRNQNLIGIRRSLTPRLLARHSWDHS